MGIIRTVLTVVYSISFRRTEDQEGPTVPSEHYHFLKHIGCGPFGPSYCLCQMVINMSGKSGFYKSTS